MADNSKHRDQDRISRLWEAYEEQERELDKALRRIQELEKENNRLLQRKNTGKEVKSGKKIKVIRKKLEQRYCNYRNLDVWIWDVARETSILLTRHEANDTNPIWAPDGQRIVFSSLRQGNFSGIYSKAADGIGESQLLGSVPNQWIWPGFWSAEGKDLIVSATGVAIKFDIRMLSIEGEPTSKVLFGDEHNEIDPQVSPDGNWVAYASDESGQFEVYVSSFPEVDKFRQMVSTTGGDSPLWAPDGRALYYRSSDADMAVDFQTGKSPKLGMPRILFRGNYVSFFIGSGESPGLSAWDINPDGRRFLMMREIEPTGGESATQDPRQISVILNWFETLKKSGT